ncbi:glycoside hydrolase family 97 protein [Agarilytica rhodophyticola]|uniref:glycoside hydrolase family 97 protein n=1 Tax=Agarilytica rhodophyticola TaxID=1737490 RepID=UPI000B344912|nr:glycoside hydrolase family 97 protein [Agarilytica rhodophyticola]
MRDIQRVILFFLPIYLLLSIFLKSAFAQKVAESHQGNNNNVVANIWELTSPDNSIIFYVRQRSNGALQYSVRRNSDISILGWSSLGFVSSTIDQRKPDKPVISDFTNALTFIEENRSKVTDKYTMLTGKRRDNYAQANQLLLTFKDDESGKKMRLDIRLFNEGFGFRYVLLDKSSLMTWLIDEVTSFNVGLDGTHWGQAYDIADTWRPAYETPYKNATPSGTSIKNTDKETGWGFPSLFKTKGQQWLLLHESNIGLGDHGVHLAADAKDGIYKVAFPLAESAMGFGRNIAVSKTPWKMPWRLGIISASLAGIIESNLVFHLSDPSKISNVEWIRPGISSWSWWSDHASSRNLSALKDFIDLSAYIGWPYSLVDANWNTIGDHAMEELAAYGKKRNVDLFFWYNSGGRHNFVSEEPRNIMSDSRRRNAEFAKLKRLGIKGIKVDFFQSDKQEIMNQYLHILRDAAEHEIMVVFHGSTVPRGWERTWPNLMSMESVRGAEFYTFSSLPDYGELAAYQNTILPFTRNVIGSMDYTPVAYTPQRVKRRTTNGHETALSVIFESGIQHIADSSKSLRALPQAYRDFFRQLPSAWDETRFLSGYPGRDVVMARRRGERWFVAGINGEAHKKSRVLDLSFIKSKANCALLLHDGNSNGEFLFANKIISDLSKVPIEMEKFGGFTLAFNLCR